MASDPGSAEGVADGDVVDALVQLSFEVQAALTRATDGHDLSLTQVRMLGVLRDRTPGARELADHLGLTASSTTGLLDRAERRGLVARAPDLRDKRAVTVSLTTGGREVALDVEERMAREVGGLTAELDESQRRQLVQLLRKLLSGVGASGSTG
ncbi:DNA-binding transcriptional regulator, MarR family [Quadrisphaera granulorum]|uniref:DNA-binding MarR family transcriptional regulator n=1 Tax=Quadrisphaera granulorum TaxID=317664 RepID=A0A316AVR3_9ACTN|nr:MarR family transcriptional regulator [Quadrisphaera granulorum]PWJ54197.1 DNA-binding MarR family transcriptional regulator [Quadrisphaera granulorum]SZE96336.1 DNA-binding transcriptional regulator, MarR family [Quadrisphaera granulorum]